MEIYVGRGGGLEPPAAPMASLLNFIYTHSDRICILTPPT